MEDHDAEIDQNFMAFQQVVGSLMATHGGQYAVIRSGAISEYFKTAAEALVAGHAKFPDGMFSVQQVADRPLDLGFYSHVARIR